ncbi:hypothetical protein DFH09DRAFT_1100683 [Mycena vulgaris]|nr:hypothetical protein DFH09DRAFT_1100683 [Mycena vulgaris]
MARVKVDAGCARAKVGPLMTKIGSIFGVKISKSRVMSRRTVGRAILEGGIAACMQLTHELSLNEAFTISADSTSNRGNNYEAPKFQYCAPDYKVDALKKIQASPELFPVPESVLARLAAPETQIIEDWTPEEDIEMDD